MIGLLIKILLTAVAAYLAAFITPGVEIKNFWSALVVALVLTFLNAFLLPILQFISIPVTVVTLGLFLLVINAIIILIASYMVGTFRVRGFWTAMLFSIVFSVMSWLLELIFG